MYTGSLYPRFSEAEFSYRYATVRAAMQQAGLSALIVYGTVRLVEADCETFLAWAREAFACVIFNLHTPHDEAGKTRSAAVFCALIDLALRHNGSFYLTYHRHATRAQLEVAYPQFAAFLAAKRRHDPDLLLQSDWYRHYRSLFEAV